MCQQASIEAMEREKKYWIIIIITFYFIIAEILLLIRQKIEEVRFWMTHGRERSYSRRIAVYVKKSEMIWIVFFERKRFLSFCKKKIPKLFYRNR